MNASVNAVKVSSLVVQKSYIPVNALKYKLTSPGNFDFQAEN